MLSYNEIWLFSEWSLSFANWSCEVFVFIISPFDIILIHYKRIMSAEAWTKTVLNPSQQYVIK